MNIYNTQFKLSKEKKKTKLFLKDYCKQAHDLKRFIFLKHKYIDKDEKYDVCTICLNSILNKQLIIITPCQHIFHSSCLSNMIQEFRGNYWYKCPNCRTSIFQSIMKLPQYKEKYISHIFNHSLNQILDDNDDMDVSVILE